MDIKKRTLTSTEENVLLNDLLDIQDWADKAIDGQIVFCKKRRSKRHIRKLLVVYIVMMIQNPLPTQSSMIVVPGQHSI